MHLPAMTAMSFTGVKGRQRHLDWLPWRRTLLRRVPESSGLYDYDRGINAIAEGMWRSRHEGHGPNLQAGVVEYFGGGSEWAPAPGMHEADLPSDCFEPLNTRRPRESK